MLTHKGFSAWITCDDQKLDEFETRYDVDGIKVTCWIPSVAGTVRSSLLASCALYPRLNVCTRLFTSASQSIGEITIPRFHLQHTSASTAARSPDASYGAPAMHLAVEYARAQARSGRSRSPKSGTAVSAPAVLGT